MDKNLQSCLIQNTIPIQEVEEIINGILKNEFNLNAKFDNLKHVRKTLDQVVKVYNEKRPNWALNLKVPNEVYIAA